MNSWKKVYKCLFHVQSHIQFQRRVSIQSYIHWRVFVEQVKMISIVPAHRRTINACNENKREKGIIDGEKENGMGWERYYIAAPRAFKGREREIMKMLTTTCQ